MASMPEPMNPSANRAPAHRPARGWRALAASAALLRLVWPWACRVAEVDTMIANMTRLLNAIPVITSSREARSFRRAFVGARSSSGTARRPCSGSSRMSSSRWADCQKNR